MKLSDSEWQLMSVLWEQHPLTAREISERLPEDNSWAYTTIKTMLTRLCDKGALQESKRGNTGWYEPLVSRENAQKTAVKSLVEKAFGGAIDPMITFIAREKGLSEKRRLELLAMLNDLDEKDTGHD